MSLPLHVVLLVLLAAGLHAGWNAVEKSGGDRVITLAVVIGLGALFAAPLLPFGRPRLAAAGCVVLGLALLHFSG